MEYREISKDIAEHKKSFLHSVISNNNGEKLNAEIVKELNCGLDCWKLCDAQISSIISNPKEKVRYLPVCILLDENALFHFCQEMPTFFTKKQPPLNTPFGKTREEIFVNANLESFNSCKNIEQVLLSYVKNNKTCSRKRSGVKLIANLLEKQTEFPTLQKAGQNVLKELLKTIPFFY